MNDSFCPTRPQLLERLQAQSVTMLRAATTAMAVRSPETRPLLAEMAGGCLAFSGTDIPLTCAVGVGTDRPASENDLQAVESFFKSRKSPVRLVISERTDSRLASLLRDRGYQSSTIMQNWWHQLERRATFRPKSNVEIMPVSHRQAEDWARTVAAGFEEETSAVDERDIPHRVIDLFYCLGFGDGAQPFFAVYEGAVAGGGVLHVTGETASIRTTSVRFKYRKKGIQNALLAYRLNAAARAGCRFAFSSTDGPGPSARNLRRFGFATLSTSHTMCLGN